MLAAVTTTRADLKFALDREWYHTIELAPGAITPGWFDTRAVAPTLPWPASLEGKRCLDVATFDGFWAFEMERRGAAEVHAIDVLEPRRWDWPVTATAETIDAIGARKEEGRGFDVAHAALGSKVQFRELSVYDLDPEEMGEFDLVYVGSLLIHLQNPVRALERIRSVCRGQLLLVDNIDISLSLLHPRRAMASFDGEGRPWWWKANAPGLVRMVRAAGFEIERDPMRFYMPAGNGHPKPRDLRREHLRNPEGRHVALTALKGDPHAAILARPA